MTDISFLKLKDSYEYSSNSILEMPASIFIVQGSLRHGGEQIVWSRFKKERKTLTRQMSQKGREYLLTIVTNRNF